MSDDEETRDVPRGRNKRARISVVPVNGVGGKRSRGTTNSVTTEQAPFSVTNDF